MPRARWRIRLSTIAERDFLSIIIWTGDTFGPRQASIYRRTLLAALGALHAGPFVADSVERDDIQPGLRSLHVARRGRRGRHFIAYRALEEGILEVIRILHDTMDIPRQV